MATRERDERGPAADCHEWSEAEVRHWLRTFGLGSAEAREAEEWLVPPATGAAHVPGEWHVPMGQDVLSRLWRFVKFRGKSDIEREKR